MKYKQEDVDELVDAVKDYLEWGAMTGSDRDLFHDDFARALKHLGVKFNEPTY